MITARPFLPLAFGLAIALQPIAAIASNCFADMPSGAVEGFLESPESLWRSETSSSKNIASAARGFAKLPATLQVLMRSAARANPAQRAEIGEGLAGAYSDCVIHDSIAARRIADAVRQASDDTLSRAYRRKIAESSGDAPGLASPSDPNADRPRNLHIGIIHTLGVSRMSLGDPFKLDSPNQR